MQSLKNLWSELLALIANSGWHYHALTILVALGLGILAGHLLSVTLQVVIVLVVLAVVLVLFLAHFSSASTSGSILPTSPAPAPMPAANTDTTKVV